MHHIILKGFFIQKRRDEIRIISISSRPCNFHRLIIHFIPVTIPLPSQQPPLSSQNVDNALHPAAAPHFYPFL